MARVSSRFRVSERTVARVSSLLAAKETLEPSFCRRSLNSSLVESAVASFIMLAVNAASPSLSMLSWRCPAAMRNRIDVVGVSTLRAPRTGTPLPSSPRQMAGNVVAGFAPADGMALRSKSSSARR